MDLVPFLVVFFYTTTAFILIFENNDKSEQSIAAIFLLSVDGVGYQGENESVYHLFSALFILTIYLASSDYYVGSSYIRSY